MSKPDFGNILKVLRREAPDRPTLFEFFLNRPLYEKLAGPIEGFETATVANRVTFIQGNGRFFAATGSLGQKSHF